MVMMMEKIISRVIKASVTSILVIGAALFAVMSGRTVMTSAATVADISDNAWQGVTSFSEPAANDDGTVSYNPFTTDSVSGGTVIPAAANGYGLGLDMAASYLPTKAYGTQTLDLSKAFTHKSNVYFGGSSVTTSGDGMSFVLARSATPFTNNNVLPGSAAGIWGTVMEAGRSPADWAIQNSFVITMDTNADTGIQEVSSLSNNMDDDVDYSGSSSKQYVGYGYPGLSSMYKDDDKTDNQYYTLNYGNKSDTGYKNGGNYDLVKNTLNTGGWHQLQVDWVPDGSGGGKLTYTLKIRGTAGTVQQTIKRTVTWSKADIDTIFGSGTTKLTWGYIASAIGKDEPHAVTFEQMGDVSASLDARLIDEYTGDSAQTTQLNQKYAQSYDINMPEDSATWPTSGTLSVRLATNKNYSFVKNTSGTVDVAIAGTVYKAVYDDAQHVHIDTISPLSAAIMKKANNSLIQVEVEATGTDKSLEGQSTMMIRMGSGSTIRQASAVLPVPQEQKRTQIQFPSFTFGHYGIADFMTGITGKGAVSYKEGDEMAVNTDSKTTNVKLSVALAPFTDLAPNYTGGHVHLKFGFRGQNVNVTDNNQAVQVFSESKVPDVSSDELPSITVDKMPNVTAGEKTTSLQWTVEVTPAVSAASK